ncbi:hypothetical protein [Chengkuizengella marina]|uniref:Uncharacterized protein n=1 Tax=Chengkuizengella marina TaxID=2507566 RepID=A0A6N9Q1F4_9BACL|nr:hypothetical protein [Chengkuizengella marina]NBI29042.1 hypothetical protein [Chengkuizengella marina]
MSKKLIVSLFLLFFVISSTVFAHHPYSPKRHISGFHENQVIELVCIDTSDSRVGMTNSAAVSLFEDVLYDNSGYDGMINGELYFLIDSGDCSKKSSSDLSSINYRFYIEEDTTAECGLVDGKQVNCIDRVGGIYLPDGTWHADYGIINFREYSINTIPDGIIYHELGHLLGMIDGYSSCPSGGSTMHYACNYPSRPTSNDLETVAQEILSN